MMEYVLEKTVKFQRHIELPIENTLLDYLNSENIHPDILDDKEVISVIAKNGIYIEINLIGTLILEMAVEGKDTDEIVNEISILFDSDIDIIKTDTIEFLEELINKGYMVKLCLA